MKQNTENLYRRVQKLTGNDYARIYKVIRETKVTNAYLEDKRTTYKGYGEWNTILVLVIEYENGKCSFPITDLCEKWQDSRELEDIFLNLVSITNNKQRAELMAA